MFIIRGKNCEVIREDFHVAQHLAYTTLIPKYDVGSNSYFDVVAYIPGGYVKCEGVFYRGCNALAMPTEFCNKVWPTKK